MTKIIKSFYDWCLENDRKDLLDRWDYELNNKSPNEVSFKSNKKYWFKCPKCIHESQLHDIQYISSGRTKNVWCKKCRSFAQHIIDDYGEEYFNKVWNEDNVIDPWEVPYKSTKKAIFNCLENKNHKPYKKSLDNFTRGQRCPYCSGRKICKENSLGTLYPEVLEVWSDKNDKSPYEYSHHSIALVWWKCKDGKHEDYQRMIYTSTELNFRCLECSKEKFSTPCESKMFDPEKRKNNKKQRTGRKIQKWRKNILKKDDFTCQCCGTKSDVGMNVHHILGFSSHEDLRIDENNGITLCENCHNVIIDGSFHNIYGTKNNTPEQLKEYINNKRKEIGIEERFSVDDYLNGKILKPIKK